MANSEYILRYQLKTPFLVDLVYGLYVMDNEPFEVRLSNDGRYNEELSVRRENVID